MFEDIIEEKEETTIFQISRGIEKVIKRHEFYRIDKWTAEMVGEEIVNYFEYDLKYQELYDVDYDIFDTNNKKAYILIEVKLPKFKKMIEYKMYYDSLNIKFRDI